LRDVLAAQQHLRDQRRAFLASVLEYNEQIAQYALSVAAPGTSPQTVAGMLVGPQLPQHSVLVSPRSVQPVSGEQLLEPVPQLAPPGDAPSPFRDVTPR
jgi:hypothetical protein